jgi:hypothetical protein
LFRNQIEKLGRNASIKYHFVPVIVSLGSRPVQKTIHAQITGLVTFTGKMAPITAPHTQLAILSDKYSQMLPIFVSAFGMTAGNIRQIPSHA